MVKTTDRTLRQLKIMAEKLRVDPFYMAWVIATYQEQEKLPDRKLIEVLNTSEEMVAKLSLCKRPDTHSEGFLGQIEQISGYTLIDSFLLVKIIRQVESIAAISAKPIAIKKKTRNVGQLGYAAARDRTVENEDEDKSGKHGDENDLAKR